MKITKSSLPDSEKSKMPLDCDEHFQEQHFWRTSLKCQLVVAVCLLFFFVISVFILTMFTVARMKNLEEEVEGLKYAIVSVKNLEQDLINTIIGFENGDLYPDEDVDSIVEPEVVLDTKDDDYNDEQSESESGNFTLKWSTNLTKDFKDGYGTVIRNKRNVVGATADGIPINSEPYAERKRTSNNKRLYAHGVGAEPAKPTVYGSQLPIYSESYVAHRDPQENISTTTSPPVHYRSSRVMNIEGPPKTKQIYKRPTLKSGDLGANSNENMDPSGEFTVVRHKYRQRNSNIEVLDGNYPKVGRIKHLPSIHYSGDTSKYIIGQHRNFFGNGHLQHPQQTFTDWKPKEWAQSLEMDKYYDIKNGIVTIGESGLYYIYAQIYYLDDHDLLGYWVQKNGEMILQCTITLHSSSRKTKGNTCFTAGVEYLGEGDTVSIADITEGKFSIFETGKSFFGLIKIGDAKIR